MDNFYARRTLDADSGIINTKIFTTVGMERIVGGGKKWKGQVVVAIVIILHNLALIQ